MLPIFVWALSWLSCQRKYYTHTQSYPFTHHKDNKHFEEDGETLTAVQNYTNQLIAGDAIAFATRIFSFSSLSLTHTNTPQTSFFSRCNYLKTELCLLSSCTATLPPWRMICRTEGKLQASCSVAKILWHLLPNPLCWCCLFLSKASSTAPELPRAAWSFNIFLYPIWICRLLALHIVSVSLCLWILHCKSVIPNQ